MRDKHYDKTLGGLDWNAVRASYEPLALAAPSEAAFYRVLNQMIGELGQSHMMITGPGAEDEVAAEETAEPGDAPADARPPRRPSAPAADRSAIPGSPCASSRGARPSRACAPARPPSGPASQPGFVVTPDRRAPAQGAARLVAPAAPRRGAVRAPPGRDAPAGRPAGHARHRQLPRQRATTPARRCWCAIRRAARPVQIGFLPPIYPEVRALRDGDVGVIAFNIFFLEPVLADIKKAVARFQQHHVRALVIDLRGNPGGQGAMSIPVASLFVDHAAHAGDAQVPRLRADVHRAARSWASTPFLGPLAILTDEGTASASEMLAAGLQEAKRAVVVGDASLGAVLPSVVEALPGGAVMQYVVADFKTPKGVLLEGRGVQPDKRVVETRAALRTGRDPVLDAALVAVRASRARKDDSTTHHDRRPGLVSSPGVRLCLALGCAARPPPAPATAPQAAPLLPGCARPTRSWPTPSQATGGAAGLVGAQDVHIKLDHGVPGDGDERARSSTSRPTRTSR